MDFFYFNDFLRKERLRNNMTQEEFGRVLGISRQAISNLELYKSRVSYDTLIIFCNIFKYRLYFQSLKKDQPKDEN